MSIEEILKHTQSSFKTLQQEFLYIKEKREDIYLTPILLNYYSSDDKDLGLSKARDYLFFDDNNNINKKK